MVQTARNPRDGGTDLPRLLAYVVDLEVEVDRLRRHNRLVQDQVRAALHGLRDRPPADGPAAVDEVLGLLHDLQDLPGYHPAHDQVVSLAVRPLAEQLFRWHQRQAGATRVTFELKLEAESIDWFPARLRLILDNLLSNALKYGDPDKAEMRVTLEFRTTPEGYEFCLTDNGVGMGAAERARAFDLLSRAAPARLPGLRVGLPVVKLLVEQSGGSIAVSSGEGQGTTVRVLLPRYELDDYLL